MGRLDALSNRIAVKLDRKEGMNDTVSKLKGKTFLKICIQFILKPGYMN